MNFVKVLENENDNKKALFEHEGSYYLYSYVNNEFAHETMVFPADENGDWESNELAYGDGYMSSDEILKQIVDTDSPREIPTQEKVNEFLVVLRDSGATNMFGATPYIVQRFGVTEKEAGEFLVAWMESFNES